MGNVGLLMTLTGAGSQRSITISTGVGLSELGNTQHRKKAASLVFCSCKFVCGGTWHIFCYSFSLVE